MKATRKWTRKGACAEKQGKSVPRKQESQRKEEGHESTRKMVGVWTIRAQGVII